MNIFTFVLLGVGIIVGCSVRNRPQKGTRLLEVGGISDPKQFGANFSIDEVGLGVFKVCSYKVLARCSSSAVVTKDRLILTHAHGTGYVIDQGTKYFDEPTSIDKLTENITLVSAFNTDDFGRPVEPERFKLDALILNPHTELGQDYMLFSAKDFERFKAWSFPFPVRESLVSGNEIRMFSLGFPWPYLNKTELVEDDFSPLPTNFDLHISTGLVTVFSTGQVSSEDNLKTKKIESFGAYDGSSGSAVIDQQGFYIGMVKSALDRGQLYQQNSSAPLSPTGPSIRVGVTGIHRLKVLDRYIDNLDFVKTISPEFLEKRRNLIQKVQLELRKKASNLEGYLENVFNVFKKMNMTRISVIPNNDGKQNSGCYVLGTGKSNEDMYDYSFVRISKIEIELLSPLEARMRYFVANRNERKFFEFWKIGKSGWSPWFNFHSSRLFAETRIESIIKNRVDGIELRAFAPFLLDKKNVNKYWPGYLDIAIKHEYSFTGQLLEAVIGGLYPAEQKDGRSIDNWTIAYCTS